MVHGRCEAEFVQFSEILSSLSVRHVSGAEQEKRFPDSMETLLLNKTATEKGAV